MSETLSRPKSPLGLSQFFIFILATTVAVLFGRIVKVTNKSSQTSSHVPFSSVLVIRDWSNSFISIHYYLQSQDDPFDHYTLDNYHCHHPPHIQVDTANSKVDVNIDVIQQTL